MNNVSDFDAALRAVTGRRKRCAASLHVQHWMHSKEFYDVYRDVLISQDFTECIRDVDAHVRRKRIPVPEVKGSLPRCRRRRDYCRRVKLPEQSVDRTAMFNHLFIKFAFMESWRNILPPPLRGQRLMEIERRLNLISLSAEVLTLNVPIVLTERKKEPGARAG